MLFGLPSVWQSGSALSMRPSLSLSMPSLQLPLLLPQETKVETTWLELFDVLGSKLLEVTVATSVTLMLQLLFCVLKANVKTCELPDVRVPMLQMTLLPLSAQLLLLLPGRKVNPAGGSVRVTLVAVEGPLLITVAV